ncbi:MAG TPA: hypothetical protein VF390_01070, partial [Patescibacteria group bacterium]
MFGSFVAGMVVFGSALKNWSFQETDAFSLENIGQLFLGTSLLFFSYFLSKNKGYYPLKKHSKQNKTTLEIGKTFHPKKIELHTNLHGLPVTHDCGAPSPICLRAIQINPNSDSREKDYEKKFYNFLTGEIVVYDKTKPDHRELNEHFLWMMEGADSPNLSKSY